LTDEILVKQSEGDATVTFNRAYQRNAIEYKRWLELRRIAIELERDAGGPRQSNIHFA